MPFLIATTPGSANTSSLPSTGISMPVAVQNMFLASLLQNPNQSVAKATADAIIAQDAKERAAAAAPPAPSTTVAPPPTIPVLPPGSGDAEYLTDFDSAPPTQSFMDQYGVWVGVGVAGALLLGVVLYKRHQRQVAI